MAKVITVSQKYPFYHPQFGKPTFFVKRIWLSMIYSGLISMSRAAELSKETGIGNLSVNIIRCLKLTPKGHTIRAGSRFKTGDMVSLRVWGDDVNPKSLRCGPYHSKQITIVHDVKVTCYSFEINHGNVFLRNKYIGNILKDSPLFTQISLRDGFDEVQNFIDWFMLSPKLKKDKVFKGQIICWNDDIIY